MSSAKATPHDDKDKPEKTAAEDKGSVLVFNAVLSHLATVITHAANARGNVSDKLIRKGNYNDDGASTGAGSSQLGFS